MIDNHQHELKTPPSSPGNPRTRAVVLGSRRMSLVDYHPAVGAAVLSNTLRDCVQVRDMVDLCRNNTSHEHQDSFMCHAAMRYYDSCRVVGGGGGGGMKVSAGEGSSSV
jgi:hypothetical protein